MHIVVLFKFLGESKEKWVEKKKGRIATNASFVTRDHVEG